jgi:AraC-like DNA-binding protein
MQKVIFSSDHLPANLDDRKRFSLWRDLYTANIMNIDHSVVPDAKFSAQFEHVAFDDVAVIRAAGTINGAVRTSRHVAADRNDQGFAFWFNPGPACWSVSQRGRETLPSVSGPTLMDSSESSIFRSNAACSWDGVVLSRKQLLERVPDADDTVLRPIDPNNEAVRHLRRYLEIVLGPDGIGDDPALNELIGMTLLDLVVLALGASGDSGEIAEERGLGAARRRAIQRELDRSAMDPAFSLTALACRLGLTPRYVQALLAAAETSFTDELTRRRLVRARDMLASSRYAHLSVTEIGHECGFSTIAHFHRVFRRFFDTTPGRVRRTAGAHPGDRRQ